MNNFTSHQIINLPTTNKEEEHQGRKRTGYHVYLSYYFYTYNKLSYEEKCEVMIQHNVWHGQAEDDVSIDSTLTPRLPMHYEVCKAAACNWNSMEITLKEAWKERARVLNDRPATDGRFEEVPRTLTTQIPMKEHILESLSTDWLNLVRLFKQCLLGSSNKIQNSQKVYRFGNERICLRSQCYKSFFFNYLLQVTIFGYPLFSTLLLHELVHKTKKQAIIHLFSQRRIGELFNFGGMNAASVKKKGYKHICCAKVNLRINRKNIIGYVVDEERNVLKIRLDGSEEGDEVVEVRRPVYDEVEGIYIFQNDSCNQDETYTMSQIWPVRIKINNSGQSSFILNVTTFKNDRLLGT